MHQEHYVLLGLGRARSPWLSTVSQWTTSGALPASFIKCLSSADLRQKLSGMQPYSALLIEADVSGFDRELVARARDVGVPTIVVGGSDRNHDYWQELDVCDVLATDFLPSDLLYSLTNHGQLVRPNIEQEILSSVEELTVWNGRSIAVCGAGGTGVLSVAIAIAQHLAASELDDGVVALADLARNGEQAMLHDSIDLVPSVEELVEAHRLRRPNSEEIRALTFAVESRRYQLLLGVRKSTAWTGLPTRAVEASLQGLKRTFRTVLGDITADFEGERETGSRDVEERNAFARTFALHADVVVVVGAPTMKGLHGLARTFRSLIDLGVENTRVLAVFNQAPKSPLARSELTSATRTLLRSVTDKTTVGPIFVPECAALEAALRDGIALPKQFVRPLGHAIDQALNHFSSVVPTAVEPEPIVPGSLGLYSEVAG